MKDNSGVNKAIIKAQKGIEKGTKASAVYIKNIINEEKKSHPLILILLLLILGIIILIFVGWAIEGLVGFFSTGFGIITLVLLISAIGLYFYLRYLGIRFKGWLGATIEITLLFLFLIMFMGVSNALMRFFMSAMPIIIILAVIYFFYKGIQKIKDPMIKLFTISMAILFIIVSVVANMFIVPYTFGDQKIIEIDVTQITNQQHYAYSLDVHGYIYNPFGAMVVSTAMNPYLIGLGELSRNMWKFGIIHKYIINWKLVNTADYSQTIAESYNNIIYIEGDNTESLYSCVYLNTHQSTYYLYTLYIWVYDANYKLLIYTTVTLEGFNH